MGFGKGNFDWRTSEALSKQTASGHLPFCQKPKICQKKGRLQFLATPISFTCFGYNLLNITGGLHIIIIKLILWLELVIWMVLNVRNYLIYPWRTKFCLWNESRECCLLQFLGSRRSMRGESQIWQWWLEGEGGWGDSNWLKLNKYTSSC